MTMAHNVKNINKLLKLYFKMEVMETKSTINKKRNHQRDPKVDLPKVGLNWQKRKNKKSKTKGRLIVMLQFEKQRERR